MTDIDTLKNRKVFFLGVNTGYAVDGTPTLAFRDFYERRSSQFLDHAIVGNVVPPGGFTSNASTPVISSKLIWTKIAGAIAARGTNPGIQLATAWDGYSGMRKFVAQNSREAILAARQIAATIDDDSEMRIVGQIATAGSISMDHGFRHIQIHAAHGYLINILSDTRLYRHADRFLDRINALALKWIKENITTSIRFSICSGDAAFDAQGQDEFHDKIACLDFDFYDVSSGFYNIDKRLIYPSTDHIVASRLRETLAIANRHPSKQFILSGRALQHNWLALPHNLHLGICRDLIANPDVLFNRGRGCGNTGKCHYYSRGQTELTCGLWHARRGKASNNTDSDLAGYSGRKS